MRLTFDAAPVGMALVGLRGEWLQVNRELCRILGRGEIELLGLTLDDLTHADDRGAELELADDLLAGRRSSYVVEKRYVRPDGTAVWCEFTGSVVRTADGRPLHLVAHVADLTERRQHEASLRQHERRLQALADGSDDVFLYRLRLHPDVAVEYVSDGVALTGWTVEDVVARPELLLSLVQPDGLDPVERLASCVGVDEVVAIWQTRDGREICTRSRNMAVVENGRVVAVEGLVRDISGQQRAERGLRRSEARFRSLVQNASDALVVTDRRGTLTYATPSVHRILGWDPDEMVGVNVWDYVHPDEVSALKPVVTGRGGRRPVRLRVRTASGDWHWMEAVVSDLRDDPAVGGMVINARDIADQHEAEEALRTQALTDPLTGLPNRTLIEDRVHLAAARRDKGIGTAAVVVVDVDRFSVINQALGHARGDALLRAVADRMVGLVDDTDTVGRFAADEFVLCVEGLKRRTDAVALGESLRTALARPFDVDGTVVTVTVSVGIAFADRRHKRQTELVAGANLAMRQAKAAGGDAVRVFAPQLYDDVRHGHAVAQGLRTAIDHGELVTFYQPIIDLDTGVMVSAEALVRWQHPTDGLVAPDAFIPVAEETGLITALGDWVLDDACRQLAAWRTTAALADASVSVNFAARQIADAQIAARIAATLARHGLPPSALTVEVTETAALQDGHLERLRDIHALGVRVALDDFGTHYSSLSYLQQLPVDQIKIDRSFIVGITTQYQRRAIVTAVAQLSRALRIITVAEGIETQEQEADLILLGVDRGQGFLYNRPVPAQELAQLSVVRAGGRKSRPGAVPAQRTAASVG
ncbi:MAG: EAL domain-containing protein [Actinomycetes bacterium]